MTHRAHGPRALALLMTLLLLGGAASASDPAPTSDAVRYIVSLREPQTQMVEISIVVPDVETETLDLYLPVWRPGRYSVLDLAGGLREVTARDARGRALGVTKRRKSHWQIDARGARQVTVTYRIYANALGDRTRHVDDTHAFLSGSSVFLYSPAHRERPVVVQIQAPKGWRVATGMEPLEGDPWVRTAASYDVLVDSPIEIGVFDRIDFDVNGTPHEIIIWPAGIDHDETTLVEDFSAIVREQTAIFRDTPYQRYVFLIHSGAGAGGGTEHLNSTIMQTSRESIEGSIDRSDRYRRFLGLVSHEMFHTWNVKQLRPAGIVPYDYQRENYTTLLWVAEGTTSYYDDLTLARTGLMKTKKYLTRLGDTIDAIRRRPGARVQSLEDSSFDAWIKFNRTTPDDVNSTVSFYSKGALASLLLDMEIRGRTDNAKSLDDVMREMYHRHPLEAGGFTRDDLVRCCEDLTGSSFATFFESYIKGTETLPLEDALQVVGLELIFEPDGMDDDEDGEGDDEDSDDDERSNGARDADAPLPMRPYLGLSATTRDGRAVVRSVRSDGPAYAAGIIAGDELIALDGRRLTGGNVDERVDQYEPRDVVTIHLMRRDELRTLRVVLGGEPAGGWVLRRVKDPTDAQEAAWKDWIEETPGP